LNFVAHHDVDNDDDDVERPRRTRGIAGEWVTLDDAEPRRDDDADDTAAAFGTPIGALCECLNACDGGGGRGASRRCWSVDCFGAFIDLRVYNDTKWARQKK